MIATSLRHGFALTFILLAINLPANAQDEAAMKLAKELTTAGAKMFEKGDGAALAAQYMDDGEIAETTVEPFGSPVVKVHKGMEHIKKIYEAAPGLAKLSPTNEVRYARFIQPDTLLITGDFSITDQGKSTRFGFTQVRRKIGDAWKIVSLELIIRK